MKPIQFIHAGDVVYSMDGKPYCAEDVGEDLPPCNILYVVPHKGIGIQEKGLAEARAFSNHYIPKSLAPVMTRDIELGYDPRNHYSRRDDKTKGTNQWLGGTFDLLFDAEADHQTVEDVLRKQMQPWMQHTPEQILRDRIAAQKELYAKVLKDGSHGITAAARSIVPHRYHNNFENEREITRLFKKLPEWMQLNIYEQGMFLTTRSLPSQEIDFAGSSPNNSEARRTITAYINPDALKRSDALHTLREEITHGLQKSTEEIDRVQSKRLSSLFDASLEERWQKAAEDLIHAIRTSPRVMEAATLIKKTEPDGGSLYTYARDMTSSARELLVDVFDAEVYLRKQGKSAEETKETLVRAFGEDCYNISHEFLERWMQQAQAFLAKDIGAEKAQEYYKKWQADPLNHRVTITELPPYKTGLGVA